MNLRHNSNQQDRATPLFPDVGVVAFVPEEWGSIWLSRHQILTRLAQYFHVVWKDPAREWRQIVLAGARKHDLELELPGGFCRYSPEWWLPKLYRPTWLASYFAQSRIRRATALLRQKGCRSIIFYLWRPHFDYVLECDHYDISCYHIVDEYSFSEFEQPIDTVEAQLIKRVDQVFIHSPALLEKKGRLNPHTLFVPNGVNYASFSAPHGEPADLRSIPHPRLGYVGTIKTQLDLRLLCDLASRHPEWSLVLVGPKGYLGDDIRFVKRLEAMRNVYFLGLKQRDELCAYPQHMDVCLLPYKVNDYTKYIYPLKLHEYLAGGKPIVGSPIRSLLEYKSVIEVAYTVEEWSEAVHKSLMPSSSAGDTLNQRRGIAKQFAWDIIVYHIARSMCQQLDSISKEAFSARTSEFFEKTEDNPFLSAPAIRIHRS